MVLMKKTYEYMKLILDLLAMNVTSEIFWWLERNFACASLQLNTQSICVFVSFEQQT